MREGDYSYPSSCLEVMYRGFTMQPLPSGLYEIKIQNKVIQTYCEMDRHGGGWTLVTKASNRNGWNKRNSISRNTKDASEADYSIFEHVDHLKHSNPGEVGYVDCHANHFFDLELQFRVLVSEKSS